MLSDEALHERLCRGDLGAFDVLYERHARPLFAFVCRHLADRHEAEDVLHETFMALLREREAGRAARSFRAWTYQVARNLCLNRLRSRRRGARALAAVAATPTAPTADHPERALEARETAERLRRAVERLPSEQGELYALRAGGLSYDELSAVLEIPVGTVKSRMHDLVSRLRQEMAR
ncbi:MAG: sigma-70 family RNA polymerase sigma factor [Polyangiaceae bacterium]|nr:sigma-70 family RNA polymerase sigma factor [Polyangiaceae bacterium]